MERKSKIVWAFLGTLMAIFIVVGSYFYSESKQKEQLAKDSEAYQNIQSNSKEKTVQDPQTALAAFTNDRSATHARDYLLYVASEKKQVQVAGVKSMGAAEGIEEAAVQQLNEHGVETINYTLADFSHQTTQQFLANDGTNVVNASSPDLVLLPTFSKSDYETGVPIDTHLENLSDIYEEQRLANPEALVVFQILPESTSDLKEDEAYHEYLDQVRAYIKEQKWNVYDLQADFANENFLAEGGFTEEGDAKIQAQLLDHLMHTTIDATTGFNGDNAQAEEAAEQKAQEEAQAQAQAEAERQAQAEREAQERAAQERAAQEAAEAEAARQAEEEAANRQQNQDQLNPNVPVQPGSNGAVDPLQNPNGGIGG